MGYVLDDGLIDHLNNMSPASQLAQIGTRLDEALGGVLPAGSISRAEIADDAINADKLDSGAVGTAALAANAVNLAKVSAGLMVGITAEDAKTTSREENIAGLSSAIALANSLKTVSNAHGADATDHTTSADTTNYPVSTDNATDLASLLTLAGDLLTAYDAHDADAELGSGWAFHKAQEAGDHSLASAVVPTTLQEAVTRLNDLKTKLNAHDADATTHGVGSQHQEATANASYGASILVSVPGVVSGDNVIWGIIDNGTGSVSGVSASAGTDTITFTFSADPQNDAIINYAVFRTAT